MKPTRLQELFAEIRTNFVAFISVVMFVCLGIGLFLGIYWTSIANINAAERFFEAGTMHDIEVQFPYGLTDDDIAQVKQIDGVTDAEPGYLAYAMFADGADKRVLKIHSLTSRIDVASVVEGVLPKRSNEIALLDWWATDHNNLVGDALTLDHDVVADSDDADGMELLNGDRYTVTALVSHPAYLSKTVGTLGVTSIGTGDVDCAAFVAKEAFDKGAFVGIVGAGTFSVAVLLLALRKIDRFDLTDINRF